MRTAQDADRFGLDLLGVRDQPYRRDTADALTLLAAVLVGTTRIRALPTWRACRCARPPRSPRRSRPWTGSAAAASNSASARAPSRTPSTPTAAHASAERRRGAPLRRPCRSSGCTGATRAGSGSRASTTGSRPRRPDRCPRTRSASGSASPGRAASTSSGRVADGWIAPSSLVPPKRLAEGQRRLDDAAARSGRDPAEIRRVYVLEGALDGTDSRGFLHGPPRQWIYELTELAIGHGIDSFLYAGDPENLPIFALEVVPAVREQITRERAGVAAAAQN